MTPKYTYLYSQPTLIFPLNNLLTVSVLSLAVWQTINVGSMPTKQISPDNAANLLVSSLRTSLVKASHHQTLYVILVLHLIVTLISENMFL